MIIIAGWKDQLAIFFSRYFHFKVQFKRSIAHFFNRTSATRTPLSATELLSCHCWRQLKLSILKSDFLGISTSYHVPNFLPFILDALRNYSVSSSTYYQVISKAILIPITKDVKQVLELRKSYWKRKQYRSETPDTYKLPPIQFDVSWLMR